MATTQTTPPLRSEREPDWERVEHSAAFIDLIRAKARFIVPATIFFLAYYFALPILVGYAPELMDRKIFGNINLAYLFALSQFVMTWTIMVLYIRRARDFDVKAAAVVANLKRGDHA